MEHYFSAEPDTPERRRYVEFELGGRGFRLAAAAGVFSGSRLDPGTSVLLHKASLPVRPGVFLDLGCGYGPIACALAAHAPGSTVYAVDVNARALDLVRDNAKALGLDGVVAATPDEVPDDVVFDEIWSNPPIRVGKQTLHGMLARWLPRLGPDGTAWLVVARHLGADSLQRWLTEHGWPARRHASQKGFRVLAAANTGDGDAV